MMLLLCGCGKPPLASQPSPLRIEMRSFEKVVPGCGDPERREQACFSFQVRYPEVTVAPAPEVKARLNARIAALLQPAGVVVGFEEEAAQLAEKYESREAKSPGEEEEPAWFVRRTAEVVHSTAAALAVRAERTEYLGGAASSSAIECVNLVPATGETLRMEDLVEEKSRERLRALAEARFRAERKIGAGQSFSEAGYVFPGDRFELPRCFLVVGTGLEFVFSPDETGGAGQGPTHLVLPWGDLEGLIRKERGVVPEK
jgi:hypothetical protein